MEKIPEELFLMIAKEVPFQELLNLKIVCKKWNYWINQIKPKELVIIKRRSEHSNSWYHEFKPIDLKNVILCDHLEFLKNLTFINHLRNLESLKTEIDFNDLEKLNLIPTLKVLEIENILDVENELDNKDFFNINLRNLNFLKIFISLESKGRLRINSPNLKILYVYKLFNLEFVHPQSIKEIKIESHTPDFEVGKEIRTFKSLKCFTSLEVFKADIYYESVNVIEDTYKSLKRAHFYCDYDGFVEYYHEDYSVANDYIIRMMKDRSKFGIPDLKIYLNGFEFIGDKNPREYSKCIYFQDRTNFYEDINDFEEDCPYPKYVAELNLWHYFKFNRYSFFTEKCKKLRSIDIDGKSLSQNEIITVLKCYPKMDKLSFLLNPKFNQSFYNLVFKICPLITKVSFKKYKDASEENEMNYDLILSLKFLDEFKSDTIVPKEFLKNAFLKLKFLNLISCKIEDEKHSIANIYMLKLTKNSFHLELRLENKKKCFQLKFSKLYDVFEYLENIDMSKLCKKQISKSFDK